MTENGQPLGLEIVGFLGDGLYIIIGIAGEYEYETGLAFPKKEALSFLPQAREDPNGGEMTVQWAVDGPFCIRLYKKLPESFIRKHIPPKRQSFNRASAQVSPTGFKASSGSEDFAVSPLTSPKLTQDTPKNHLAHVNPT